MLSGTAPFYLKDDLTFLDYDTGSGEYLLSLHHPYVNTSATEGYLPNVELCRETLMPLGIDFRQCSNPSDISYPDNSFDMIINRHGDFDPHEVYRLLRKGGIFVTEQVGEDNDRNLVERVLPGTPKPFPHIKFCEQRHAFEETGFEILRADEAYRPITIYDVGAFIWFACIIEWEFPDFG